MPPSGGVAAANSTKKSWKPAGVTAIRSDASRSVKFW